jgi:carboxypeptidase T
MKRAISGLIIGVLIINTILLPTVTGIEEFIEEDLEPDQTPIRVAYHSYSSLKSDLQNLGAAYPSIAHVYDIGDSWEKTEGIADRDVMAIKISDNVSVEEEDEPDILFIGGIHAREWISVEVPFYLAQYLIEAYSTDQSVKRLVDSREIWIIPLLNPDGLEYSRTVSRDWRKNRRENGNGTFGVDLNRNFGYKWGLEEGSSGDPASDTYRGTAPFSEPETQALRDLVATHDFIASISYHSYSQLILYPWGYTTKAPLHEEQLINMAKDMDNEIKNVHGKIYTPLQSSDLYLSSGDSEDWLYGVYTIAAFTVELRPQNETDNGGKPFELPEDQIIPTWEENKPAALYLIKKSQPLTKISLVPASFTYYPNYPCVNETITFSAANVTAQNRTIQSYDWDFGDGTTGSGGIVTHSYFAAGDYPVKLRITDDEEAINSTTQVITVAVPLVTTAHPN